MNTKPKPVESSPPNDSRRERTSEEEAEWEADKRAEYEADRICGHDWSNI